MRFPRLAVVAVTATLVLAACNGDDEAPPADDETEVPEDALPDEQPPPEGAEEIEIEDGIFAGQGIVMPVPEGWDIDPMALAEGVVVAAPPDEDPVGVILGVAGLEENPFFGFQGLGFEEALDLLRNLDPEDDAVRDESVDIAGADQAHLVRLEAVTGQAGETDELIILAEDGQQQLGLFNYSAPTGEFDDAITDLILAEGGLDPDSEPTIPEMPELDPEELDPDEFDPEG